MYKGSQYIISEPDNETWEIDRTQGAQETGHGEIRKWAIEN